MSTQVESGAAWWCREAARYVAVCVAGWSIAALVTAFTDTRTVDSRPGLVLYTLIITAVLYGFLFAAPTLLILSGLSVLRAREQALRLTALLVLPLPVLGLPIEMPPSSQYAAQVLFQVPIQIAAALLMRPVRPRDASRSRRPAAWWYAVPAVAAGWLTLVLATGAPLYADWLPLGPQRAAMPVGSVGALRFTAEPGHQYVVYQHRSPTFDEGETCYIGSAQAAQTHPAWIWSRPPAQVTHEGLDYTYRETVSHEAGSGTIELSCSAGPMLVEDTRSNGPSPTGPAIIVAFAAMTAMFPAIAFCRRRSRPGSAPLGRLGVRRLAPGGCRRAGRQSAEQRADRADETTRESRRALD